MLYCHVCMITIDNGDKFGEHLNEKQHERLMKNLEDKEALKTKYLRQQTVIKTLTDQLQNQKKNMNQQYCNMCRADYMDTLDGHTTSREHKELKAHLHPMCLDCGKSFQERKEYNHHLLSPQHMIILHENFKSRLNSK